MKGNTIATEAFSSGRKSFFLDFKLAKNRTNYMRITNLIKFEDGSTRKARLYIWQEDFEHWISAFASLFRTAANVREREVTVQDLFHQAKEKKESGIKSWNQENRPREKFLTHGPKELSLAELLAMLIGSGNTERDAVKLCEQILHSVGNDLERLSELSHVELAKFKGMGLAKSSAILSALELGKRAFSLKALLGSKVLNSSTKDPSNDQTGTVLDEKS